VLIRPQSKYKLPTLACSLKESTMSLSTLEGMDGSLATTMLFILDTLLPGF
jgi:hypothetical protein